MARKIFTNATISVPLRTYSIGSFSRTSSVIPAAATLFRIEIDQSTWPLEGDLAFHMDFEASQDNGQNWQLVCPVDAFDTIVPAHFGNPAGVWVESCQIPWVGQTGRKIRLSAQFFKQMQMALTIFLDA